MLNEQHGVGEMVTREEVETIIRSALTDVVRRPEFDQRMSQLKTEAHNDAELVLKAGIAEAEARLNSNVKALLDGFTTFKEGFTTWRLASDDRINNWSTQITRVDGKQSEQGRILGGLQLEHTRLISDVKALNTTIHGDSSQREGAPSLYELVNRIDTNVTVKDREHDERLQNVLQIAQESETWIKKFEQAQRERRERRGRWLKQALTWISKPVNLILSLLALLALVGAISLVYPPLGDALKAYFHLPLP